MNQPINDGGNNMGHIYNQYLNDELEKLTRDWPTKLITFYEYSLSNKELLRTESRIFNLWQYILYCQNLDAVNLFDKYLYIEVDNWEDIPYDPPVKGVK